MEHSIGCTKSVYGMLMTVLFYTTGIICGLRTVAWLVMHMLVPAISLIIALYYLPSSSNLALPTPASGGAGFASSVRAGAGDAADLLFKLVHTAAGHDILVPVQTPVSMYVGAAGAESAGISGEPLRRTLARLALLSSLVGAGSLAAYYYFFFCGPPAWTSGKITRRIATALQRDRPGLRAAVDTGSGTRTEPPSVPAPATTATARCAKTKLNPAAPAFTPCPPMPALSSPLHRLDPAARMFAPRGCATPPSPADSTDSAGPATPSPSRVPSAFALAAARVARASVGMGIKSGSGGGAGGHVPVGVGKMRVVRPEEVVVGRRRAGEVFVFF